MERETGIVQTVTRDGKAVVMARRRSACHHCKASSKCCIAAGPDHIEIEARNPVHAVPGQTVSLRIPSSSLIKGAALLYLVPLAGLLFGALGGGGLLAAMGVEETLAAVGGGLGGLGLAVWVTVLLSRKMAARNEAVPVIERVLSVSSPGKEGAS